MMTLSQDEKMMDSLRGCPWCGGALSRARWMLRVHGQPHGRAAHEFSYARVWLQACDSCGAGVLWSHHHDCFSAEVDEPWEMWWGYALDEKSVKSLKAWLSQCSRPHHATPCGCQAHQALEDASLPYAKTRAVAHALALRERAHVSFALDDEGKPCWRYLGIFKER